MMQRSIKKLSGTTPASASQAIVGNALSGLDAYDWFMIDADLIGATGGTLNLYIQRKLDTGVWLDWVAFPQLTAGASAVRYSFTSQSGTSITTVGKTADNGTSGAPALAAGSFIGGHPGDSIRLVAVAGTSTSAGAAVTVYLSCFKSV